MRYEKGRKDASRSRITEVAADRFRRDGIAASGLAVIMKDAGLTNGAFYPHFKSKADLVSESVTAALNQQLVQLQEVLADGGPDRAIEVYLSAGHRDNPGQGCASAALLPELARQPPEMRGLYTESFQALLRQMSSALPAQIEDPEGVALGIYATLIGALQMARAVEDRNWSDRILKAGIKAAKALVQQSTAQTTV